MESRPSLTEPGFKYYLNETLKKCNIVRKKYTDGIYNVCFFLGLVFVIGLILFINYKGKLTPEQKQEKELKKQHYILSKIKNYQDEKRRASQSLITGLPSWTNEYDIGNKNMPI